jgi:type I restriction enzyme M protein
MNMILRGIKYQNFHIYNDDTLAKDNFEGKTFRIQVANPPYSAHIQRPDQMADDPRFNSYGKFAPKTKADLAFLQHMIYHMDDGDSRVAVLLPHGVLFRGGAEEDIRKYIIKDLNRLDAVIGLPANLFHGTSIPVCVLVLKNKRNGNSGNIMFIDASKEYKSGKNQNELTDEHIKKIVDTYVNRVDVDKFAHVATMDEIIANDYNLNIPRYVDTSEEEEQIDIAKVRSELTEITTKKLAAIDKVNSTLKLLGL